MIKKIRYIKEKEKLGHNTECQHIGLLHSSENTYTVKDKR